MGRLVEDSLYLPNAMVDRLTGDGLVLLDMVENDTNIVIKASLPGIKPEDLNIEVRENVLTISGETKKEIDRKGGDYLLSERHSGQVRRSVTLPCDVKADRAEAEFEDGTLTLTLPKAETARGKRITVKTKAKAEK